MRLRRRVVWLTILAVLAAGYFVLWITAPGPGINRQGFARIEMGMRETEIAILLRANPGDYITGKPQVKVFSLASDIPQLMSIDGFRTWRAEGVDPRLAEWYGDDGIIVVWFDHAGAAKSKAFFAIVPEDEAWLAKIRRWLRV